jgi:AcrR family transcriptional regulator
MSPRSYRMERRREATDENRQRILEAARDLLASRQSAATFSVDAVARKAGVARMTVYYQFHSLQGLIESVCDSLAWAGGLLHLPEVFRRTDALDALDQFVATFMRFWATNRDVLRGTMMVLDPDIVAVLEGRSGWRRKGLRVLLERLAKQSGRPQPKEFDDILDQLYMLTSFHTYDSLATPKRSTEKVARMVQRLARGLVESHESRVASRGSKR